MIAGPIRIHTRSQQVWVNDKELTLTAYEYKVLEYLMVNPQKVISKSELTEHIYDQDFDLDSNVIEVFVLRLRKKLDPENTIQTNRNTTRQRLQATKSMVTGEISLKVRQGFILIFSY